MKFQFNKYYWGLLTAIVIRFLFWVDGVDFLARGKPSVVSAVTSLIIGGLVVLS